MSATTSPLPAPASSVTDAGSIPRLAPADDRRFLVLFNPRASRSTPELRAHLAQRLSAAGPCEVVDVPEDGSLAASLDAAITAHAPTHLVAAGGDGTVSALLPTALRTGLPIAPVPLGTSCSIAIAMAIPDVDAALGLLAGPSAPPTRVIDVCRVNDQPMALLAALGLHADAVGTADPELKAAVGPAAYVAWLASAVLRAEPFDVAITLDDAAVSFTCSSITVANLARPGALLARGTGEVLADDGLFDVTVVLATTPTEIALAGVELVSGVIGGEGAQGPSVIAFRAPRLQLRPRAPRPLLIDGELCGEPAEIAIQIVPRALAIVAPPPADGG